MSEYTPLTEAERELLWSWWNTPSTDPDADDGIDFDDLIPVVERIIAAHTSTATADTGLRERVALTRIVALLDEEVEPDLDDYEHRAQRVYNIAREALRGDQ